MLLTIFDFNLPLNNPVLQFSIILFIILFAPIILNKFKIPHLIGLIIAGALIGPFGFNLMLRDSSIILYGTVGLLYIMFLAGLEVDFSDFKRNSGKSFVFGLFTFLLPMILGYIAGVYVLKFSTLTSILLASMFASHTLIAYPIISRFGIARNRAVSIAVGGTIITDTLALLVLAVIVGMTKGVINQEFWMQLSISIILFASVIIFIFPIIGRWFFKRFSDKISQYIFVLAMVFLGSFLAQVAGIEAIIGAFLTGLSLNRLIPRTSALMNRIEFVGNALFIPIFLIGVGMLINYKAFLQDFETIKVGLIMTLTATVSKFLAACFTQKTFRLKADERRIIFGLSNAQAAATLAAVLVGYNIILNQDQIDAALIVGQVIEPIRLLNESVLNGTILMILITCTHASFAAQKGARNIALSEAGATDVENSNTDERILIPISDKSNIQELVNLSVSIKSKNNKTGMYALNIVNTEKSTGIEKKAHTLLDTAAIYASATDCQIQKLLRYDMTVSNGIANIVKEQTITDVILNVSHNNEHVHLGSTIDNLLTKCEANIMIYNALQPLNTIKRNFIIIPPHAENEVGFPYWIIKLWNLAKNTGVKNLFYGSKETLQYIQEIHKKHTINAEFIEFENFSDFLVLAREIKIDDTIIFILSRKDHPSYIPEMAKVPISLRQYFPQNNYLLFFPLQSGVSDTTVPDFKNPSILEPLEKLDDLGKTIANLFKISR